MHELSLYERAQMLAVSVNQGPIGLCVSKVGLRDAARGRRGRLLLLHGNPSNMHDFGPLASLLRDDFDVVALDLPGFGKSATVRALRHETVLDTYARHVEAAAHRIGWIEPFYVLGHSHGAAVAQTVAALFPERIAGLVLLGSVGTPAHWGYRQLVTPGVMTGLRLLARALKRKSPREVRRRIVRAIMEPIFAPHPLSDEWVDRELAVVDARPEILVNMALVASGDPCQQLGDKAANIRAPSLFIHGAADRLVPSMHSRAVFDTVAKRGRAEYHELADTGHMLHISHAPAIADLMLAWHSRAFTNGARHQSGVRR